MRSLSSSLGLRPPPEELLDKLMLSMLLAQPFPVQPNYDLPYLVFVRQRLESLALKTR
jgi:hypothetical protein